MVIPKLDKMELKQALGSLGMGISKGKGICLGKIISTRIKATFMFLTGDGEFQEGQIYESLQSTAHQKVNNITAIMDHNKYQTDMLVADVNNIEDVVNKG